MWNRPLVPLALTAECKIHPCITKIQHHSFYVLMLKSINQIWILRNKPYDRPCKINITCCSSLPAPILDVALKDFFILFVIWRRKNIWNISYERSICLHLFQHVFQYLCLKHCYKLWPSVFNLYLWLFIVVQPQLAKTPAVTLQWTKAAIFLIHGGYLEKIKLNK